MPKKAATASTPDDFREEFVKFIKREKLTRPMVMKLLGKSESTISKYLLRVDAATHVRVSKATLDHLKLAHAAAQAKKS